MRKFIEIIFLAACLMLTLQSAWGFSLSGKVGSPGDAWQTITLGYGYNDPVGPKDIYEEYRPVVPFQYYASDATYISYFGTFGLTNVDNAFGFLNGVMCGLTNTPVYFSNTTNGTTLNVSGEGGGIPVTIFSTNTLDSYSGDLSEFPLNTAQYNYTAQSIGLVDVQSMILHEALLELGLANPYRYVWTLHDRFFTPGLQNPKCKLNEEYFVVQRNFDVTQNYPYSSYINFSLYSFFILDNCGNAGVPYSAITENEAVDPFAGNIAVSSGGLHNDILGGGTVLSLGGFYVGLTRDDVMGLKYLLSTNNVNWEATASSGGLLLQTNVQAQQTISTVPFSLLFAEASTNDPATLATNFPGITFLSITTNIVTKITATPSPYFTNLPAPYTNYVLFSNNASVYPSNMVAFTNWSPVQYEDPPTLLQTYPLAPLVLLQPYLPPAALQALVPGLVTGNVQTNYLGVEITTNVFLYYTNQTVAPLFSNAVVGGLPNVTHYTNIYYFTNQPGPTVINYDITQPFTTISTLDLANFVDLAVTNSPVIMQALYPGLQILRATTTPAYVAVTNYVTYLTNKTGSPYQGYPTLVTKPISTNYMWITNWHYTFGNVFTNHFSTNRYITVQSIWITNQVGAPYGSPFIAKTNYVTYKTNLVSGDFFLIPTNWCGFDLTLSFPLGNPPYDYGVTNAIVYNGYNTNGSVGTNATAGGNAYGLTQNIYDIYTNYNYAVYPGICEPVLQQGTNYSTNIVYKYKYDLLNVVTNHFYTNSLVNSFVTNIYYIPGGSPDLLATNIVVTSYYTNIPGGDFYIIPTNWCGFQISPLLTNWITPTNIVLTNQVYGSGTVTNAQYTTVTYLSYTNYSYSIRPGDCEPALAMATNYSTNIVTQYSYYFGNLITNSFYTNSPVVVLTTNLAILTNGLVGTLTNIVTTNIYNTGVSGDFYIPPANWCAYTVLRTQLQSAVFFTNTITATNAPGVADLGQAYVQYQISVYTNTTLTVQPATCAQVAPVPNLRRGIGRVQFLRANYDSLLGQFFQPITNNYTMTVISNGQPMTEYYQRVVAAPDILLQAKDMTVPLPNNPDYTITTPNFDTSAIQGALAGPGTIPPGFTLVFNKIDNSLYDNGSLAAYSMGTNSFLNESTQLPWGGWGSYDGTTNYPVTYPAYYDSTNLMNQVLMQVTPVSVPDGTNGVAYNGGLGVTFSASGGQPPYQYAAPNFSTQVPGMVFTANTATISGTPSAPGTFNFTLQVTDSANRVVSLNYSITIH